MRNKIVGEWGETGGLILTHWQVETVSRRLEDYNSVAIGQDFGLMVVAPGTVMCAGNTW